MPLQIHFAHPFDFAVHDGRMPTPEGHAPVKVLEVSDPVSGIGVMIPLPSEMPVGMNPDDLPPGYKPPAQSVAEQLLGESKPRVETYQSMPPVPPPGQ